jgi:hypothetical protein
MRRREFIAGLGSATAWPLAAWAKRADRIRRIGVLFAVFESDPLANSRVVRWAFAAHFLASNGAVDDLLALVIVHCGQP